MNWETVYICASAQVGGKTFADLRGVAAYLSLWLDEETFRLNNIFVAKTQKYIVATEFENILLDDYEIT